MRSSKKIFKSTLYQFYLLGIKERNSLLAKAFHLDHRKARPLPIEFARNTWDDNIVSFRKALINVERYVAISLSIIFLIRMVSDRLSQTLERTWHPRRMSLSLHAG
jgi:hypothetical protein